MCACVEEYQDNQSLLKENNKIATSCGVWRNIVPTTSANNYLRVRVGRAEMKSPMMKVW